MANLAGVLYTVSLYMEWILPEDTGGDWANKCCIIVSDSACTKI